MTDKRELYEFMQKCIKAGFVRTQDPICIMKYQFGADDLDEDDLDILHPPTIFFQVMNGKGHFCFSSGTGHETIHLASLDPFEVVKWSEMIISIEPNY